MIRWKGDGIWKEGRPAGDRTKGLSPPAAAQEAGMNGTLERVVGRSVNWLTGWLVMTFGGSRKEKRAWKPLMDWQLLSSLSLSFSWQGDSGGSPPHIMRGSIGAATFILFIIILVHCLFQFDLTPPGAILVFNLFILISVFLFLPLHGATSSSPSPLAPNCSLLINR